MFKSVQTKICSIYVISLLGNEECRRKVFKGKFLRRVFQERKVRGQVAANCVLKRSFYLSSHNAILTVKSKA
jgi:hypothetical protein